MHMNMSMDQCGICRGTKTSKQGCAEFVECMGCDAPRYVCGKCKEFEEELCAENGHRFNPKWLPNPDKIEKWSIADKLAVMAIASSNAMETALNRAAFWTVTVAATELAVETAKATIVGSMSVYGPASFPGVVQAGGVALRMVTPGIGAGIYLHYVSLYWCRWMH